MYLKALEIVGFKSFADRVRLNFQQGITCVVGPNGCGKSNVVDSIRWCIGEKSWKSLRSPSMIDIIFNGTAKRPPTNMAEVNMVFDNESRRLAVDFSEVTVTRRIFRSGESEYFLNKVQCRLKDIRDMFLDTGIGGEGYAIIDQGGVEFVLSATPEQRREIFEEAAGVSKYKAKRDEAQKKLEKVDIDLSRLMDSVILIEEQIKKLDSEARKAKLYQKYREELQQAEVAVAVENIERAIQDINRDTVELTPVSQLLSDKSALVSQLEGEVAALNLNLTHTQSELAKFSEQIATVKYQIGLLEGNITNCDNMAQEMDRQIASFAQEDEIANRRRAEVEPALEGLRVQIASSESTLAPVQKDYDAQLQKVRDMEAELSETERELEMSATSLMRAAQAEIECSGKIALEQTTIAHVNENLVNAEKELLAKNQQKEGLDGELAAITGQLETQHAAVEAMRAEIASLEQRRTQLLASNRELNEKLSSVRSSRAALNATMDMLRAQGSKNPYWVGTEAVTAANIAGVRGTLRSLVTIEQDSAMLVEEAAGHFLDSVVCETAQAAEAALAAVKAKGNARCRFIVLEKVPAAANAPAALKAAVKCAPEFDNLLNVILSGCAEENGTLSAGFWLVGGAPKVESPEAYWGRQEEVKLNLEKSGQDENTVTHEINAAASELSQTEALLSESRTRLNSELMALNTLENNLSAKKQAKETIYESCTGIEDEKARLFAEVQTRQQSLAALKEKLTGFKQEQERIRLENEECKTRRAALQTSMAGVKSQAEKLNAQLYELRLRRGSFEADMKAVQSEFNSIKEGFDRRNARRAEAKARIDTLAQDKLTAQANLSSGRDKLAEMEVNETRLREELAVIRGEFETKSKAAHDRQAEISEIQLRVHDLETRIKTSQSLKEQTVLRLAEDWRMTFEEAKMKSDGVEIDPERVKMMRRRLENMGAVNMTAPEEYDALSSRHQFLKTQINDLETAKNDLKAAIARINATTRENFRHTYDMVRDHFRRIYQSLFVGGEADLVLTDPENLLETGVEIIAQPPGKKVQSISSMSGGEKALTALSLLFSFFCVNPSPFCIMDEADAPLDEANVERYVGLLKEFAAMTQFIVITHNKRSMEAAAMLYGITMQESGVSKVMSVSLNKKDPNYKETEKLLASAS